MTPTWKQLVCLSAHNTARALDKVRPKWYDDIDLGRLDVSHCSDCVLGQLYGALSYAIPRLQTISVGVGILESKTRCWDVGYSDYYRYVNPLWRKIIEERRKKESSVSVN